MVDMYLNPGADTDTLSTWQFIYHVFKVQRIAPILQVLYASEIISSIQLLFI